MSTVSLSKCVSDVGSCSKAELQRLREMTAASRSACLSFNSAEEEGLSSVICAAMTSAAREHGCNPWPKQHGGSPLVVAAQMMTDRPSLSAASVA